MSIQTVYWAIWTPPQNEPLMNLVMDKPVSFISTLPEEADGINSYRACGGLAIRYKNAFVFKNPIDHKIVVDGTNLIQDKNLAFLNHPPFKNIHTIEYDFKWIFYSEESLEFELTTPYMHNTEASKYGYVASGSFDINKWFRPVGATYNLWEGVEKIHLKKDDPLFYGNFKTNNKVELKQFHMTDELRAISDACLSYKNFFPRQPLNKLYVKFNNAGFNKRLTKAIKNSLME